MINILFKIRYCILGLIKLYFFGIAQALLKLRMNKQIAVITGATSGLGMAYARLLAQSGMNLLITGRRKDRLLGLKKELEGNFKCEVKTVLADFTNEKEFQQLLFEIDNLESVDLLVNNAGYGCREGFFENGYVIQQEMLQVHVTSITRIIHQVVPKMIKNNGGYIVNVASLSAFFPGTTNYIYSSSKAFLVSFSECLHIDLVQYNIKVQALCPGFIKTEFHSRMGEVGMKNGIKEQWFWMKPEVVAKKSFNVLSRRQVIYIPGCVNKMVYVLSKVLPRSIVYWLAMRGVKYFKHVVYCVP